MTDNAKPDPESLCKLFVGNLDYKTSEEMLKSHFKQWGEIVNCRVMRDPDTHRSRGFGFITFKKAHMVDDAQASRPHNIEGRRVESRRAVPRKDAGKPESQINVKKLFIGRINDDLVEEDFRNYFGEYGKVTNVNIVTDKNTGKKRFAFVEFDDYDPVDKAVLTIHTIKGQRLDVRKSLSGAKFDKKNAKSDRRSSFMMRGGNKYNDSYGNFGNFERNEGFVSGSNVWENNVSNVWDGNYGSSYGGGPMRSSGGYGTARNQGPYVGRRSDDYGR